MQLLKNPLSVTRRGLGKKEDYIHMYGRFGSGFLHGMKRLMLHNYEHVRKQLGCGNNDT